MPKRTVKTVAVVMTVKNDPVGCAATLGSLVCQSRVPDEIIVVDGGSTDGTRRLVRQYETSLPQLRLIEAPGANIARGRNIGVRAAHSEIIATIDAGCRAEPAWLENLLHRFENDAETEFVAGFYRVDAQSLLETIVGLATMRGQLDPVGPESFNPSARSLALTKSLWTRAGGWPEWVFFSEDTLFDHKIRRMDIGWRFAQDAVVHWRPRTSLRGLFRQFYRYGTGRGHTQIDAPGYTYQVRNVSAVLAACVAGLLTPWGFVLAAALFAYFFVCGLHPKGLRIVRRTGRRWAYPTYLCVMWVVIAANVCGYLVGSWQRWRDQPRYRDQMEAYLASMGNRAYNHA